MNVTDLDVLAERMLGPAAQLVVSVHDHDVAGAHEALEPLTVLELRALAVTLAALVRDDESLLTLLDWTRGLGPVSDRQAERNRARLAEAVEVRQKPRTGRRSA